MSWKWKKVAHLRPPIAKPRTLRWDNCLALSTRKCSTNTPCTIGKIFCVSGFSWAPKQRSSHRVVLIIHKSKLSKYYHCLFILQKSMVLYYLIFKIERDNTISAACTSRPGQCCILAGILKAYALLYLRKLCPSLLITSQCIILQCEIWSYLEKRLELRPL